MSAGPHPHAPLTRQPPHRPLMFEILWFLATHPCMWGSVPSERNVTSASYMVVPSPLFAMLVMDIGTSRRQVSRCEINTHFRCRQPMCGQPTLHGGCWLGCTSAHSSPTEVTFFRMGWEDISPGMGECYRSTTVPGVVRPDFESSGG